MPPPGRDTLSRAQWAGFFALCLLGASGWLVDGAWPSSLPPAELRGFHELLIAVVLCVAGWKGLLGGELRSTRWRSLATASVCLVGVPAVVSEIVEGRVSDVTITALFAMVPIAVVVLVANFSFGSRMVTEARRLLPPALIGLAGILLLLPVAAPYSLQQAGYEAVVLFTAVVAAAASVWMYRLLGDFTVLQASVVGGLANAVAFLAVSFASIMIAGGMQLQENWGWNALAIEALKALCFDLPQLVLLVWLLREIAPTRFAVRFFVVPLLALVEGYALLRPEITLRMAGGAALGILGAWRLMTASQREEEPGLVLR